jgi:hypothetical protein
MEGENHMSTNINEKKAIIKAELQSIKNSNKPDMTGVKIRYGNKVKSYDVYKIPLKLLVFNKDNGRIGTRVKSHEKQIGEINEYTENGSNLIRQYLIDSKKERNDKTLESLARNGQMRHGIVTSDGIIVDGNRRASLLTELYNNRDSFCKKFKLNDIDFTGYFLAIILDEDISKKEIHRLETEVQMGEDEKVDYNAIEKYLKVRDLLEDEFTPSEIGRMMGESTTQINTWLETLKLMDEYLLNFNYVGIYTMLDKREDQFLTLCKDLKKFTNKTSYTNWVPNKRDISKLKLVGFDYIRCQYEGKEFRNLTKSKKDKIDGIFTDKTTWEAFYNGHIENKKTVNEDSVEKIQEVATGNDYIEALIQRDKEFTTTVKKGFVENIKRSANKIETKILNDEPYKLMFEALELIKSIDTNQKNFYVDRVREINSDIYDVVDRFRFKLQKGYQDE